MLKAQTSFAVPAQLSRLGHHDGESRLYGDYRCFANTAKDTIRLGSDALHPHMNQHMNVNLDLGELGWVASRRLDIRQTVSVSDSMESRCSSSIS
ncbi:unnamed protein product [Haemonchus placei]|uniref:Transposase n=1 Tax=Haemonchus placei TaxID=6290 RepID=A0A0N4W9D9_HAEPC|nr:unnamed protein product [Haemonchus placei]